MLQRYFSSQPPFRGAVSKKAEFPDAIALLALEAWAEQQDTTVLAISRDGDWRAFAEGSTRLVCTPNFTGALNLFNQAGQRVVHRAVELLKAGQAPDVEHDLNIAIQAWLDEADFEVEARSSFHFEAEPESASQQTWTIASPPQVLSLEGDEVTFSMELDCLIRFVAQFDLSVRDSIDGEYVRLNTQSDDVESSHRVSVSVTINRALDPEPSAVEVEVNRRRLHVDFGNIDLRWSYED
ncbi:PIN domain-containing protein [Hansschlegelia beijingensis]|uniref:DUF4935 domain-containing protein n=1 Tax=Hansschlegelia beijingensis TaxID=1133344 RepID=A0A7W6GEA8_9HYPH|nr:PIN domain-containing protein [Hansschlegelia beijingensis]MBB3971853.1 hypothetical protein [Hansschlegelia beijingensis]